MEESRTSRPQRYRDGSTELIIRACDMCRKKKIRCEQTEGACIQCTKSRMHCHSTPISLKRRPKRPHGSKHTEELEKRLKMVEAMLYAQNSALGEAEHPSKGHEAVLGNSDKKRNTGHPFLIEREISRIEGSKLRRALKPTIRNMSSWSPGPAVQMKPSTAPVSFEDILQISAPDWKNTAISDIFSRRIFKPLPPKTEALHLVREAFQSFNAAFPIFEPTSFMATFDAHYSNDQHEDPAWWACLNVVLALAHRFRAMRAPNIQFDDREAWGYLQNALAVATQLTMMGSGLLAVQAMLGMAIVLQGTPNPLPTQGLISATIRLAQNMGLHEQYQGPGLSLPEIEQRKRVFWIAYIVDRDISLQTGQPPAQDDEEMDVDLPADTINLDTSGGDGINFLNVTIGLAIIKSQIYKGLYSIRAKRQSEIERLIVVEELDNILKTWKERVSINLDGGDTRYPPDGSRLPNIVHKTILKFKYLSALDAIHRSAPQNSQWHAKSSGSQENFKLRVSGLQKNLVCISEARKAIHVFSRLPQGDYAYIWILLHTFVSASTTLLSEILHNPGHPLVKDDFRIVFPLLKLLKKLEKDGRNLDVARMVEFLEALWGNAKKAVERLSCNMKGGIYFEDVREGFGISESSGSGKESLEDFIRRIELISAG